MTRVAYSVRVALAVACVVIPLACALLWSLSGRW